MFDIEYVDPSPRGVNADLLEKALPEDGLRVRQRQRERRRARALGPGRARGAAVDEYLAQSAASHELSRWRVEEDRQIAATTTPTSGRSAAFSAPPS